MCSSSSPRAGHGGQVVIARGHGEASHANCRHGAGRCSMAGSGVGAGSLKILTGVLVHRVTRPLRGSVSCGSGQLGMRSRVSFLADLLAMNLVVRFPCVSRCTVTRKPISLGRKGRKEVKFCCPLQVCGRKFGRSLGRVHDGTQPTCAQLRGTQPRV